MSETIQIRKMAEKNQGLVGEDTLASGTTLLCKVRVCVLSVACVFFFLGMNPTGESQLANIPLNKLWDLCVQGNKVVQFHSNLAAEDSMRQGIGLSQAAEALLNAFEKMRSPQIKAIIREDLFEKV